MEPTPTQFPKPDPAAMRSQLQQESADYASSQKPERNQGYLASGVNRLVRGSQNVSPAPNTKGTGFTFTGTTDPYKI